MSLMPAHIIWWNDQSRHRKKTLAKQFGKSPARLSDDEIWQLYNQENE